MQFFLLIRATILYCFFPSIISFRSIESHNCFLVFLLLLLVIFNLTLVLLLSSMLMPLHHLMFMNLSHLLRMLNYVLLLLMFGLYTINLLLFVITLKIIENKLDFLCISETRINEGEVTNSLLSSLLPLNYCLSQCYGRPHLSRGGGVAIINHNSIHLSAISIPLFSSFECIGSVNTFFISSFKLFVIYWPPSSPFAYFFTEFESLLELQIASNIDSFFIGDFIIHIEDLNDYNARHFLKLLNTFDLLQHITLPTHDSGHTIDLVITITRLSYYKIYNLSIYARHVHFRPQNYLHGP